MEFDLRLEDDTRVHVLVAPRVLETLSQTCFRGSDVRQAGNLHVWNSAELFFSDPAVLERLQHEIQDLWDNQDFGGHAFTFKFSRMVGWSVTDHEDKYRAEDLEIHRLTPRSWCKRVRPVHQHILAPRCDIVTMTVELHAIEQSSIHVSIISVYAGEHYGELCGDMSERGKRIWFDHEHPGD